MWRRKGGHTCGEKADTHREGCSPQNLPYFVEVIFYSERNPINQRATMRREMIALFVVLGACALSWAAPTQVCVQQLCR